MVAYFVLALQVSFDDLSVNVPIIKPNMFNIVCTKLRLREKKEKVQCYEKFQVCWKLKKLNQVSITDL